MAETKFFASKTMYFIIAMLLVAFMVMYNYSAFSKEQSMKIECTDVTIDNLMIQKYLFSCFIYEDQDTQRNIPGTIDLSKFNQENYDSCFQYLEKKSKITLNGITIGEEIHNPKIINKFVYIYQDGTLQPTIIKFEFEDTEC